MAETTVKVANGTSDHLRIVDAEIALRELTDALRSLPIDTQVEVCRQMISYLKRNGLDG